MEAGIICGRETYMIVSFGFHLMTVNLSPNTAEQGLIDTLGRVRYGQNRMAKKRLKKASTKIKRRHPVPARTKARKTARSTRSADARPLTLEQPTAQTYKGHRIELRPPTTRGRAAAAAAAPTPELVIDDEPVAYGRLPDGQFYLESYAYDWRDDLMPLAKAYVDYRDKARRR